MIKATILLAMITAGTAVAQDASDGKPAQEEAARSTPAHEEPGGVKTLSGMSILGNEEAPKSLVIVPWKSSQLGNGIGVANAIDGRPRPVDKDVFMREVHYYEIRSGKQD